MGQISLMSQDGLIGGLYRRFRVLIHEGAKFLTVGGAAFAVTEVGFNVLRFDLGLDLFTSNAVATIVAAALAFTGNRYWTFRHRQGKGTAREAITFFALNLIGLLIQYAAIWIAKNWLDVTGTIPINIAFLIGIVIGTLFRFWSYRTWVWVTPAEPPPEPDQPIEPVEPVQAVQPDQTGPTRERAF